MCKNLYLVILLFISCGTTRQEKVLVQEPENKDSRIIIRKDYKNNNTDNAFIDIPLRYKVYGNSKVDLRLFLIKNNDKLLYQITDYMFYDKNNKPIYDIEKKTSSNQDLVFTIVFRDLPITKKTLNSYNIAQINQMTIRDSIVDNYIDFKKNNPLVFEELNRIGDTIIMRSFSKGDFLDEERIRIHW